MPDLSLPPLLTGRLSVDPRGDAVAAAREGCDGGTLLWRGRNGIDAALVLAPEVPLARAAQTGPLAAVAARDAIGAMAAAELPVHLDWSGAILVDGAAAGRVTTVAPSGDARVVPPWLVLHLVLRFAPGAPLASLDPQAWLESWSRHLMHRLAEWEDGPRALHAELEAASWERAAGDPAWIGRDEALGRLRRAGGATMLDPLTDLLEAP
jgi:hypothetical protein